MKHHSSSCTSKLISIFDINSRLKIKFIISILVASASLQLLAGCSMEAAIEGLTKATPDVLEVKKASTNELVSASQQGVITAQGYKVQSSFSFQTGQSEVVTSGGYKVYTNGQSTLFKE